jgi:hypothetical protein
MKKARVGTTTGVTARPHCSPLSTIKRSVFLSVVDLQAAINRFVLEHKLFTWTSAPEKMIQAVRRGHQVLDSPQTHLYLPLRYSRLMETFLHM